MLKTLTIYSCSKGLKGCNKNRKQYEFSMKWNYQKEALLTAVKQKSCVDFIMSNYQVKKLQPKFLIHQEKNLRIITF